MYSHFFCSSSALRKDSFCWNTICCSSIMASFSLQVHLLVVHSMGTWSLLVYPKTHVSMGHLSKHPRYFLGRCQGPQLQLFSTVRFLSYSLSWKVSPIKIWRNHVSRYGFFQEPPHLILALLVQPPSKSLFFSFVCIKWRLKMYRLTIISENAWSNCKYWNSVAFLFYIAVYNYISEFIRP